MTVRLTAHMKQELKFSIEKLAEKKCISVSALVNMVMKEYIDKECVDISKEKEGE